MNLESKEAQPIILPEATQENDSASDHLEGKEALDDLQYPEILAKIHERNPDIEQVVTIIEGAAAKIAAAVGFEEGHFDSRQFVLD